MAEKFDIIVKAIANDYVNNILFVDEEAFLLNRESSVPKDKQKELDVEAVSEAFSKAEKICGFYAPKTLEDINKCKSLVLKPDIVILDWDIVITVPVAKEEENEDADTDYRGYYSLELLKAIVQDAGDEKLKVVFIYTGETDINEIASKIVAALGGQFKMNERKFEVYSENIHILVRLKPGSKVGYAGFDRFIVSYTDLPEVVLNAFSDYVCGLMPCFAMKSLTEIRNSSAKILKVYNSELDAELLGHQMALPNPDDSKVYITKALGSGITELLMDNPAINTDLWVDSWIDQFIPEEEHIKQIADKDFSVSQVSLKAFFGGRYCSSSVEKRLKDTFNVGLNKNTKREEERAIISNMSSLFSTSSKITDSRYRFAILGHNNNTFSTGKKQHSLTLGTIIKRKESGDYLLCVQQRCDTARVPESGMNFMFIPLVERRENYPLIGAIATEFGKILYILKTSKRVELIHFNPSEKGKPVLSVCKEGQSVFQSGDSEYLWIGELKELFAQRIVAAFTSHFARVGVDEAEWLRVEGSGNE